MRTRLDIDDIPIADNHCFAFAPSANAISEEQFVRLFSLGGPTVFGSKAVVTRKEASEQVESALSFKFAIKLLSELLGCQEDLASMVDARNTKSRDFSSYIRELFESVKLKTLIIDSGFQPVGIDEFRSYVPTRVERVLRLEPVIKELLESQTKFGELVQRFDEILLEAIQAGCVGFKTIIAYRTGLDIDVTSEDEARENFEGSLLRQEPPAWFGPPVKKLRDYLIFRAIGFSIKNDKVLQIHTGLGDTDIVGSKCNPILLQNFLKREDVQPAKIVLIHGGYPYSFEASWLTNVLPNVYLELSTPLPPYFAPAVSAKRYVEAIQQTPSHKIVYGSDAGEMPEMHWLSAKISKSALEVALSDLMDLGMLNEEGAVEIAKKILFENVKRIYKLK